MQLFQRHHCRARGGLHVRGNRKDGYREDGQSDDQALDVFRDVQHIHGMGHNGHNGRDDHSIHSY